MPVLGIFASQITGKLYAPTGSMFHIASTTLSTDTNTITFSSIPADYTHLQLRVFARATDSDTNQFVYMTFNSDTATNYSTHRFAGDGSSATVGANTTDGKFYFVGQIPAASATSGIFGAITMDILDYANTNKYKTTRQLFGYDANGSGNMYFGSGNWRSSTAITSLTLTHQATTSGGFATYSSFALYGVK